VLDAALKLVEAFKLPAKIFFAVSLATAAVLFLPSDVLPRLGLDKVVSDYRPVIGAAFLVSVCICLASTFAALGKFIWPWIAQGYTIHRGRRRLRNLNAEEKSILSYYIEKQTRGQYLSIASGVVKVLEIEHILFRASALGLPGSLNDFSYAIQPWAWEYLNKHPKLLN
jgi:hypothetical protein